MAVRKHQVAPEIRQFQFADQHIVATAANGPFSTRDLSSLHRYCSEQQLTLDDVHMESPAFLLEWTQLRDLRLYACKFDDWSPLGSLSKVERLHINTLRSRSVDLSFLAKLKSLKDLGIGYVPHLTTFPDLSACKRLKRLNIFTCNRLSNIDAILRIPKLESLGIVETPQDPKQLEKFMRIKTLKSMSGAFGSKKKDDAFRGLLTKHGLAFA